MIEITKIENDFINKVTVATVNVYEVKLGIQRLRDTFVITLDGVYDITDPSLADLVYTRLAAIGYDIIIKTDSPAGVTPVSPDTPVVAPADNPAQQLMESIANDTTINAVIAASEQPIITAPAA